VNLFAECPTIASVGVELEGGWICTCPIRPPEDAEYGIHYDPTTGRLQATGIMRHHRHPATKYLKANPDHAITLNPKIGAELLAKDKFKRCECIPPNIKHDGTVQVQLQDTFKGEISPTDDNGNTTGLAIADWPAWIAKWYPPVVNMTCGLHVHVRFKNHDETYLHVMRPELEDRIIAALVKWGQAMKVPLTHPFWHRLAGGSIHCRKGITPEIIQAQYKNTGAEDPSRYYVVNFCKTRHNTLEVRILPMFKDKHTAIRAINCVLQTIDTFTAWALTQPLPPVEMLVKIDTLRLDAFKKRTIKVKRNLAHDYTCNREQLVYW
jgi:hypothetical protein